MIRILIFLLAVSAVAAGLHWLADRPGTIVVEWQDYVAETSVFLAVVLLLLLVVLLLLVWSALRQVWASPARGRPPDAATAVAAWARCHLGRHHRHRRRRR